MFACRGVERREKTMDDRWHGAPSLGEAQSDFRLFYETAPGAFLVLATDRPRFTILAATDAYLRATRTSRDIVGRGIFEVFPDDPDDPASSGTNARLSFERVLETRAPDTMAVQKHSIPRPVSEGGGFEERYWSPLNVPVLGGHGEILCIHHRVEDVTEFVRERQRGAEQEVVADALRTRTGEMEADVLRRTRELQEANRELRAANEKLRATEPLLQNERRLRALADSMPQLAWTAEPSGEVTWFNRRFYEYTGIGPEEARGSGWQRAPEPAVLPELLRRWNEAVATGEPFEMEMPLRRADGQLRRFLARAFPVKADDGRVIQWFGTSTDITELAEAREALREEHVRKDQFLGMLSHELRNPLAPIRNSTYVLRHVDPGSEQARRARSVIERQTDHLARLVDDLLDVTRIARGKIALRRVRTELREVVLRAAEDVRRMLEDRGVRFRVELPETQVWANVDATRITQVVGNLLQNASKFTRRGEDVTLALSLDGGEALLRVRDTGAGIDPALLPRVFDPFVQGERTLARTEGGLGLGLALVKGLTELHGGSVRVESAGKARGSEFTVRLPLVGTAQRAPPRPTPVERRHAGRRVLVVEDNADAAESLAEVLRMMGHEVEVAYDGPSGVEAARESRPDVVLCDLGLPGMSGYDVARALRARHDGGVRLIAVSGYAQPEDVRRSVEAGFDAHVAKPPDPAHLERLLA